MRAGPSTAFPVVDVVPGRTPVDVHGCVAGYSWCDVSADNNRGWVYAGYLSYPVRGSYVPLVEYVSEIDVPIVSFSVGSYWDSYYRGRAWYGERARWRAGKPIGAASEPTGVMPEWNVGLTGGRTALTAAIDAWNVASTARGPTGSSREPSR